MKNRFALPCCLALLLATASQAQKKMSIPSGCAVDDSEMGSEHRVFEPSKEAQNIVKEITAANFIQPNFEIYSGDVDNALAFVQQGKRYIVYNTAFIEKIKNSTGTDWAAIFVFAHEIGHHVNYHDFTTNDAERRQEQELEADVYAGSMMYMLGAGLAQSQAGIEQVAKEKGSTTHPPRRARSEAVANGWKRARERVPVQPAPVRFGETAVSDDNMVLIRGGQFSMGSEEGQEDEKPVHSVNINDFYLAKYELTVAEFRAFVEASGYKTDAEKEGWSWNSTKGWVKMEHVNWRHDAEGKAAPDRHPVLHVSWNDAAEYCRWLKTLTGRTYRLPTEAEWEYAAGNGSRHTRYSWGNENPAEKKGGNVKDETRNPSDHTSWSTRFDGYNDGYWFTAPIGTYSPNDLGLYDMTGNVLEWCSDWYGPDYYKKSTASNPGGPTTGDTRVCRGGAWNSNPQYCRVSDRNYTMPGDRYHNLGFRLARTP